MSIVNKLISQGLITPPSFLKDNIHYECMMGSIAYGCSNDNSDIDLYGFCIPPKDIIFPHTAGYIIGFGKKPPNFEQYQQHGIIDPIFKNFCLKNDISPSITLNEIEEEIEFRKNLNNTNNP